MTSLPRAEQAQVDIAKVTGYLLSQYHPRGRTRADFFIRFAFRIEQPEVLIQALLRHGANQKVTEVVESDDEGLKAGDVGVIVHVHQNVEAFEVEFFGLDEHTIAVATVLASQSRPISA